MHLHAFLVPALAALTSTCLARYCPTGEARHQMVLNPSFDARGGDHFANWTVTTTGRKDAGYTKDFGPGGKGRAFWPSTSADPPGVRVIYSQRLPAIDLTEVSPAHHIPTETDADETAAGSANATAPYRFSAWIGEYAYTPSAPLTATVRLNGVTVFRTRNICGTPSPGSCRSFGDDALFRRVVVEGEMEAQSEARGVKRGESGGSARKGPLLEVEFEARRVVDYQVAYLSAVHVRGGECLRRRGRERS